MTEPIRPLTKVERAACRLLAAHRGIGLLMARLLDADDSVAISAVLVMAVDPGGRRATLDLLREVQALGDAGLLVADLPLTHRGGGR